MRFLGFICILVSMILLSSCNKMGDSKVINKDNVLLTQAELINDENKYLIGTEINDKSLPIIIDDSSKLEENESIMKSELPTSNIVKKLSDEAILPPVNIISFETRDGISPEIIIPNGSAILFTQENASGWSCEVGDKLIYAFEKYASSINTEQKMIIGYILNETLYPGEEIKKLNGSYQLDIKENGNYYIYIISATSDYLALKEGTISVITNE